MDAALYHPLQPGGTVLRAVLQAVQREGAAYRELVPRLMDEWESERDREAAGQ